MKKASDISYHKEIARLSLGALFAVFIFSACGNGNGGNGTVSEKAAPERDIKTVMEAHVTELMKIPGVTAVAIGELEDKTPCIKVYVIEKTAEIVEKVPAELEGHPVVVEVSGVITPMSGD